jgi:BASS family bile acid:Na+ symporter
MIAAKLLPIGLALIMLGLGLSLTIADFQRVLRFPKAIAVGLFVQMLVLPTIAYVLCGLFKLSPEYSIGLMILSASPGGVLANLFSHLGRGEVALNVTLTAINSVLAAITLPLIVDFAIRHFGNTDHDIGLQYGKAIEVFAIVLVPVAIGMAIRRKNPGFADRADRPIRIFSVSVLVVLVFTAILSERQTLMLTFSQLGGVMLVFNVLSMAIGYLVPTFVRISRAQSVAIALEIGLHNATLALYISLSVLGVTAYALPTAIYSVLMFFTASAFTYTLSK